MNKQKNQDGEKMELMKQLSEQQQMLEDQLKIDLMMSNIFANFMQKHVSSKYFMLSVEYADQLIKFN